MGEGGDVESLIKDTDGRLNDDGFILISDLMTNPSAR